MGQGVQTQLPVTHQIHISTTLAELTAAGNVLRTGLRLPVGAVILRTHACVTTVFNAGTNNTLDIGDGSDVDRFMASATVAATALGLKTGAPTALPKVTVETEIVLTYAPTGTTPTTGAMDVIVEFSVPNARP